MVVDPADPVAIYQAHVDFLSEALLRSDADMFIARMSYPHTQVDDGSVLVCETPDQEREILAGYFDTLAVQQVTEFIRLCTCAMFITATRIEGEHTSHVLSRGQRLADPYPNRLRLELIDGIWRETACANGMRTRVGNLMSLPIVKQDPVLPELPKFDPERIRND